MILFYETLHFQMRLWYIYLIYNIVVVYENKMLCYLLFLALLVVLRQVL